MVYCPIGSKYPYSHGGTEYTEMVREPGKDGRTYCPCCGHEPGKRYQLSVRTFVKKGTFDSPQEAKAAGLKNHFKKDDIRVEMV